MSLIKNIEITPLMVIFIVLIFLLLLTGTMANILSKRGRIRRLISYLDTFFYQLYFEIKKNPIAKNYVRRTTRQLQKMSVFTKKEVYARVSRYFVTTVTIMTATIVISLFLFDDFISIALCSIFAYVIPTVFIEQSITRVSRSVYIQLKYAIESLRLNYLLCENVVEALENVDCGPRLATIFDELKQVLVSANGELRLKEFYELTPFRPIQTLGQVCYHINNTGDGETFTGKSAFVETLLVMTEDIENEISRLNYQQRSFGKIEYWCLLPIPMIKVIEAFFLNIMPGTALIYKGPAGYIIRVFIIIVCIYSYNVVARANSPSVIKENDRIPLIAKLFSIKEVKRLLVGISPKDAKQRKLRFKLHNAFSKKSVEEFYLEKVLIGVVAFVVVLGTFVSGIVLSRDFIINNTGSLSLIANNDLDDYDDEDILALDNEYITMRKAGYVYEEEELEILIRDNLPGLVDMQVKEQVARLNKKFDFLQSLEFKWYFILIASVLSFIAFKLPDKLLDSRIKMLEEEEEEEFIQIQTLMIILISMNCDTLEAIEYLSQLTRLHKEMFVYCYHSYVSDPQVALEEMEEKTPIPDFKRFIRKLKLTIDELSLGEAFSDLIINRAYISNEREEKLRFGIDKKRRKCGKLVTRGFILTVILLFVFPVLYLGLSEMMSGMESLKGLN